MNSEWSDMGHFTSHSLDDGHRSSSNQHHLHSISYDSSTKSTKGASKMRRDSINGEVCQLRDLLPLPSSTRQRLSQLQLMALICVYVRKTNYFDKLYKTLGIDAKKALDTPTFGFSKFAF